jgi:hypothetical protein
MNGPTKKPKIGLGLGWLELITTLAGFAVVVGLWKESGHEWKIAWDHWSWAHPVWPTNSAQGSALVAIGVFVEVSLGIFAARSAKVAEIESREKIAELNSETERLRKENNETDLLLKYRDPGWTELTEAMRSYAGTKFRTEVIRDGIEPSNFRWRLELALKDAGWLLIAIPSGRYNLNFGIAVHTIGTTENPVRSAAAVALADWLNSKNVAAWAGVIGDREAEPGLVVVQVGPRPETMEQYESIRQEQERRNARPVTPPQA